MISIEQALKFATKKLSVVSDRPRLEAEILLCHHLGCNRARLVLDSKKTFDMDRYFKMVEKRATSYPIEYITNEVSFYDTTLYIKEGVLIPRPETELLVDEALQIIQEKGLQKVAEIGIGSGAISICLAKKCQNLKIIASDINPKALEVAKINIEKHKLNDRVKMVQTSLLDGIDEQFDMIVSNPPYIAKNFNLPKNVAFEPHSALFGGERGDELLQEIVTLWRKRGVKYLVCEMGYDQKEFMRAFFKESGIQNYRFYKDLAQLDRGFVIEKD